MWNQHFGNYFNLEYNYSFAWGWIIRKKFKIILIRWVDKIKNWLDCTIRETFKRKNKYNWWSIKKYWVNLEIKWWCLNSKLKWIEIIIGNHQIIIIREEQEHIRYHQIKYWFRKEEWFLTNIESKCSITIIIE